MNISGTMQSGVIGLNRMLDNTLKSPSDQLGNGKPSSSEQASGQALSSTLSSADNTATANNSNAVNANEQAQATKVVTDAGEVLGTNIDTRA
ncbi:hypothetical protein [Neptunomonas antarctica]|uniref:Uncharacterized protein n=1 Tax=Neptunomonas antarctica TaxID=619304 RepID=A0A1N7JG12_9GAMM|nr:hypothetical protein [Neptunomonas antarctica]SIS48191.1 hypothetical protein SAMN05421760_1011091 [Neptunomonas antarctica]